MDILTKLYEDWSGCRPYGADLLPLSGSARKYYRITGDAGTVIGCIGTNPAENRAFLAIAERFEAAGLHAPHIFAVSGDGMSYLQEDLGDGQLFELLKPAVADCRRCSSRSGRASTGTYASPTGSSTGAW